MGKGKVNLMEVLVGFEMPNKYMISDGAGMDCFVAGEKSQGFMGAVGRQVFSGAGRPFNIDMALLVQGGNPVPFARFSRPFTCECCCLNRPSVHVHDAMGNPIGTIHDPFNCCHISFAILDRRGTEVLSLRHHCCDCKLTFWGCPCGCQQIDIDVVDTATGQPVACIRKKMSGAEMIGMIGGVGVDAHNYVIEFGAVQNPEYKVLLIALALFLDYRWFEHGGQSQRENSVLGRVMDFD